MFEFLTPMRGLCLESVALRMLLALLCGGIIGLERTFRRRPAGFRTHMLICLGAAMTTLTSQFLSLHMNYETDIARLGAQVVAGIGFIGAGTIIVTRHQRVRGLTTAAGMWTAAIVGLSLGAGFYEGGVTVTVLILMAELVFFKVERLVLRKSPEMNLYIRYDDSASLERILNYLRDRRIKVLSMQITREKGSEKHKATAIFLLRLNRKTGRRKLPGDLVSIAGVASVEVLSC